MRLLLVAGDPSGDHQTARLAAALRRRWPAVELYGYGGPLMRAAGVRVDFDLVALSAIGLFDVLPKYPRAWLAQQRLVATCRERPPDAAVLVDCGAFNLRLAAHLKPLGVPVLGYFPPGSWSGSRRRAEEVAACYSAVATPFPQALPAYAELGLPATLVGHPLVDELAPVRATRSLAAADPPVLGLLPGSRDQEVRHILAPMLGAAKLLQTELPGLRVRVSRAASAPRALFDRVLAASGARVEVVEGSLPAMADATALLIKSGTVTLEAALLGVPMVVCYRASFAAYAVAGLYYWPRPKFWAMPNVLAQDFIVPQIFQYQVTPQRLAREVRPLLTDTPRRATMLAALDEAVAGLGGGGAVERTVEVLARLVGPRAE